MNNEQTGASAGTIDTPEFREILGRVQGWRDGQPILSPDSPVGYASRALITYIMDWHSAGVAAITSRQRTIFGTIRARLAGKIEQLELALAESEAMRKAMVPISADGQSVFIDGVGEVPLSTETAIAAAREQALEEAAKHVENGSFLHDESPYAKIAREAAKAIRALASQPASTAQPKIAQGEIMELVAKNNNMELWLHFKGGAVCLNNVAEKLGPITSRNMKAAISDYLTQQVSVDRDAPLRGAPAVSDGVGAVAAVELPEGFVIAPHYRGYACLGTGNYLVNHSAAGEPAELVISVATDEQKAGRKVGDEQDNIPGEYIQPDIMCVRVRFENVAGLDVLENQLRYLRNVHFAAAAPVAQDKPVVQDLGWFPTAGEVIDSLNELGWRAHGDAQHEGIRKYWSGLKDILESSFAKSAAPVAAPVVQDYGMSSQLRSHLSKTLRENLPATPVAVAPVLTDNLYKQLTQIIFERHPNIKGVYCASIAHGVIELINSRPPAAPVGLDKLRSAGQERTVQWFMDAIAWYADHKDESTRSRIEAGLVELVAATQAERLEQAAADDLPKFNRVTDESEWPMIELAAKFSAPRQFGREFSESGLMAFVDALQQSHQLGGA